MSTQEITQGAECSTSQPEPTSKTDAAQEDKIRQELQMVSDHALRRISKDLGGLQPDLQRQILTVALNKASCRTAADELIAMEGRVRPIIDALPLKARAVIETILKVHMLDGMSMGVDWGNKIINDLWHSYNAVDRARRKLPDDPDIEILERACRLASQAGDDDYPKWETEKLPEGTGPSDAGAEEKASDDLPEASSDNDQIVRIEKAHDEFKPIVRWLLNRSPTEKIAALALDALLNGDVERAIESRKLYDGLIGNELGQQWEDEIAALMDLGEQTDGMETDTLLVASYILGLSAVH